MFTYLYASSYARAAFQSFVVQWKHQTHECKKGRDYVMVHGLLDSSKIKKSVQCFTPSVFCQNFHLKKAKIFKN